MDKQNYPVEVIFPALPKATAQVFVGQGTEYVYTAQQMRAYALETLVSFQAVGSSARGLTLIGQTQLPEGGADGDYVCRVYATTFHKG